MLDKHSEDLPCWVLQSYVLLVCLCSVPNPETVVMAPGLQLSTYQAALEWRALIPASVFVGERRYGRLLEELAVHAGALGSYLRDEVVVRALVLHSERCLFWAVLFQEYSDAAGSS